MQLTLTRLSLHQFKGIPEFTLELQTQPSITRDGSVTNVCGPNASGKTTLMDGFIWLLFGKDSQNRTDFEILPLDRVTGQRRTDVTETSVEAHLLVDNSPLVLKRVWKEKWTKKRGNAKAQLTGHETEYYIDGVPVKERDYKQRVNSLVDEKTFRLLTNPRFFNDHLSWQERRLILLEVCGDISDAAIIASSPKLQELYKLLGNYTPAQFRKILTSRRQELNARLDDIPSRIDELEQMISAIPDGNRDEIMAKLSSLDQEKRQVDQEKLQIEKSGGVAEATKELRQAEAQIMKFENDFYRKINQEVVSLQASINAKKLAIEQQDTKVAALAEQVKSDQEALTKLAQEYREEEKRQRDEMSECPTCGQPMPPDIQNLYKSQKLEAIAARGKQLKADMEQHKRQLEEALAQVHTLTDQKATLESQLTALENRQLDDSPDYRDMVQRKNALQEVVTQRQAGKVDTSRLEARSEELAAAIQEVQNRLAQLQQLEKGRKRIDQLRKEQRELNAQFEQTEKALDLMDEFDRVKVAMLSEKINEKFRVARFRLFNQLISGGLEPCCETTFEGVPWDRGLNNSAQIAVGLDIINTLSEHYNVVVPCFIDNAEAITDIPATRGQQVRLYVTSLSGTGPLGLTVEN